MAIGHSLPLLQLPKEGVSLVLGCMDNKALFFFSLLSRKSKNIVRNSKWLEIKMNILTPRIIITISEHIYIASPRISLLFYKEAMQNMNMLEKPNKMWVWTRGDDHSMELSNPFELKNWLEHFLYIHNIMNVPEVTALFLFGGCQRFDLGAIKSTFQKFGILQIQRVSPDHFHIILEAFLPDIDNLGIGENLFRETDDRYQKLLIQNLNSLYLGFFGRFRGFNLNELLVCNAAEIFLQTNGNFEGMNEFLKLWMKGANPRLRLLSIRQADVLIFEEILKGVTIHRVISANEDIFHGNILYSRRDNAERQAVNIRRFDGTTGTVITHPTVFYFLS